MLESWKKNNNKTKEMRDKTEKLTKSGYNHFVSCMMGHEEMVAEKTAFKKINTRSPKKHQRPQILLIQSQRIPRMMKMNLLLR